MKPKRPSITSEVDVGKAAVQWLADHGWDVYQEVPVDGHTPDIVGLRGSAIGIVECKTSLSLDVLGQAARWSGRVHLTWIAVPRTRGYGEGRHMGHRVCSYLGLGLLEVRTWQRSDGEAVFEAHEELKPRLFRKTTECAERIRKAIRPEHKHFTPAGSQHAGRWTPFRATCEAVARYLKDHPGACVSEVVRSIDHHYASRTSAQGSIAHWAERGKMPGVTAKRERGRIRLYPAECDGV